MLIQKILTRGVAEIIDRNHLEHRLRSGEKLRVKLGIDPTSPDLHLGHTVVLRKLRQFQDAGHQAVLIIGDFTGQIGDPSGRSETRKVLSEKEVKTNLRHYLAQASKVIDVRRAEVAYNGRWHGKRGVRGLLELAKSATVQQILKRDDFEKRLNENADVSVLEMLYPLLQGYDSVAVKADVELGGTDQKFNLLMGRRVQRYFGPAAAGEQDVITVPLIEGTDGVRKMSKSVGNYIGITEEPQEMFGKLMAVPDALLTKYFETLTDVDEPRGMHPKDKKLLLAETIVGMYHSPEKAKEACEEFIKTFSEGAAPEKPKNLLILKDMKDASLLWIVSIATSVSKSDARRLINQKAVELNGTLKTDPRETPPLKNGDVLKIGKHRFYKIEIKQ